MDCRCYGCFCGSLDDRSGICTACGYDNSKNRENYPLALPAGSILYGQYIVGKVLGQGGYGITYLAQDYQTKGLVAIKEFFPETMVTRTGPVYVSPLSGSRGEIFQYGKTSFLEEAKTMAKFSGNPNVAGIHLYFEENGTGYYVMEYIDGIGFDDYIRANGGRLSWKGTWEIMLPVLNALEAVHAKGVIHRDVSPDNIYITRDGRIKLLDFGAARHSLGNVSQSLDIILKHGFAPKEQYSRRGRQGPYTDVYAASATMYYALTGVKPDDAIERSMEDTMPPPTVLGARISPAVESALLVGLAVESSARYQTVGELRKALTDATRISAVPVAPMVPVTYAAPKAPVIPAVPVVPMAEPAQKAKPTPRPRTDVIGKLKRGKWWIFALAAIAVALAVILAILIGSAGKQRAARLYSTSGVSTPSTEQQNQTKPPAETGPAEAGNKQGVHAMRQLSHSGNYIWDPNLGLGFRTNVENITFRDFREAAPYNAADLSAAGDRSVLCWRSGNTLIIAADGMIAPNPNAVGLFSKFPNLRNIEFNNCFDTSNVTNMAGMFDGCVALRTLYLGGFVTSKVTNMSAMFRDCAELMELDIKHMNTSSVTDMSWMFSNCNNLTDLDLSFFDTSSTENMEYMFSSCRRLSKLDLSSFDTTKVTKMRGMFYNCKALTGLNLLNCDTSCVTDMSEMFNGCYALTRLYISNFDTSNVTDMSGMLQNCRALRSLNMMSFDTAKVTTTKMSRMFDGCNSLTDFDCNDEKLRAVYENRARN